MRGPYYATISSGNIYVNRSWYRTDLGQKVKTPLPYYMRGGDASGLARVLREAGIQPVTLAQSCSPDSGPVGDAFGRLHNKAYAAWVDKVKGSLQLGADFGEAGQTLRMIAKATKALQKPMRALQQAVKQSGTPAGALKTMGSAWLTWHFGVRPLIETIHELTHLLDSQIFEKKQVSVAKRATITFLSENPYGVRNEISARLVVRVSGFVEITNMQHAYLETLGLVNPASVAWELVPFSFVCDWFYPVGLYLQSLSSLVGRLVVNGYSTRYYTANVKFVARSSDWKSKLPVPSTGTCWGMQRRVGVPGPVLQKTLNPWSTSVTRALTSISLLSKGLKS